MITQDEALRLKPGDILYSTIDTNADGTPVRWRVNGKVKTWKTRPGEYQVPLKHGMYDYDYLIQLNK